MSSKDVKREREGGELTRAKRAERLESFAARALDFEEVSAALERFALTALGLRGLRTLAPLHDDGARWALRRADEMIARSRASDAPHFAGVSDPLPALAHAHKAGRALEDEAFIALRAFLEAVERLSAWVRERDKESPALAQLCVGMPDFEPLLARITATIDERGRVKSDASPLLARLRREETEVAAQIDKVLRNLIARAEIKTVLSDPNPHRRGGRPVLAVKAKSQGRVTGIVHDRSQTDQTVFIEPRDVVAFGNKQAELEADERREVERILLELTRTVLSEEESIEEAAERLMKLELAFISTRFASETNARVPQIAGERGAPKGLLLRSARHPLLLEQMRLNRIMEVTPIDLRLGGDFDLLIITGPNTGGKTLALKTAGLAGLFVRCGLPFPCAEGSIVPLYDGIVADIGDEQEIAQSLSTFSSHLVRIKQGLQRAGPKTLVLLDELGGGTDPDEGAALSEAILEHLMEKGAPTLTSTHIGKLKEFAFRHPRAENACVEFDPATLRPAYHLLLGTPGESGALVIARRMGLPPKVVDRAHQRLVRRDAEVQKLMADVRHARTQAEKVRSAAESRLEDVEKTTREIQQKKIEIDRKGEMLEAEAQRGIEERVREARRKIERIQSLLPQIPPAQRKPIEDGLADLDRELSGAALSDRRQQFLDALTKGSFVYLPRYRQRVPVQKVDRDKRSLRVLLGGMNMTVSFDEVTAYESR
jgi:DNA mismatch repair protein MutS2